MRLNITIAFIITLFGEVISVNITEKDAQCLLARKELSKEHMHPQGSYLSQKHLEKAIELCPELSNAYFEKSVAFVKRGLFTEWKKLIDKAVKLNPKEHLSYRAWCQFFFLRNYEEAIIDLEKLIELKGKSFIGIGQYGEYDLRIILGLCHKMMGNKNLAVKTIEESIQKQEFIGPYDYLHLGVLYMETNQYDKALETLNKQIIENPLAEAYYYLGKLNSLSGNSFEGVKNLKKAHSLYKNGRKMTNYYYEYIDQIYEKDILESLSKEQNR